MKMAAAFIVSALLICWSFTSCTATPDAGCEQYVPAGDDFTVHLPIKLKAMDRLAWKRNGENIFKRHKHLMIVGKDEDISEDGSLRLRQVTKEMEGTYKAEVHTEAGKINGTYEKVLCVQERVKIPTIKHVCESEMVNFTCGGNQVEGVSYKWYMNGKELKDKVKSVKLLVKEERVFCTVSNNVSNMSSEASSQDCRKSVFDLPEVIPGISTWVLVGVGGGVVLILLIVVIVCCILTRRRQHMHVKDEEELRLGWTNPNQHPHQHHPHPSNQQHPHHSHPANQQRPHHHHSHPPNQQHPHNQQPAGHTGPRPHRNKQQRQRNPNQPSAQPQPSPRRQLPREPDEEQPPPLPQPRKNAPRV
ncbi:T-cell surface antigen CD2-like [Labrus mixtus]|uniref:T-cell surface antigen CD2-like n=1 Tax=Labrus mixtus TaxID=508554 RepID=UPI0029C0DACD|nr:T-cell surface antigen CD2-like [Labrus mixtus]